MTTLLPVMTVEYQCKLKRLRYVATAVSATVSSLTETQAAREAKPHTTVSRHSETGSHFYCSLATSQLPLSASVRSRLRACTWRRV
ncbi:unnamed protein product [Hymenolepis diminuta]|uniref:Secreted protein n=1 Tax=Hymenolepis diminuta TaxID=6216 RepID=A0A0R3SBQ7_HYMDI|nr:unnamed protein product [Hymenolepis diminuta]